MEHENHLNQLEQQALPKGLHEPSLEKDACGIGLIANYKGRKSHVLVLTAIQMLENMEHRGACGCEPNTGDGAGILIQMPHNFFKEECPKFGFNIPDFGQYGAGNVFFPTDEVLREKCRALLAQYIDKLDLQLLGYRPLVVNNEDVGNSAQATEPVMEQLFVTLKPTANITYPQALERKLFILRNYATHIIHKTHPETLDSFYFASLSYKTIIYKGQLTTYQLRPYFEDLRDLRVKSAIALVHSRFSTNTFPKWRLAQPFRYIAHNGEINTIRGNLNWWKTKEILLESSLFSKKELEMILPVCDPTQSDSANFDNVVELLHLCGRSLPQVLMMMIPEAWQGNDLMSDDKRAFYEYQKSLMEPWDGPAAICFTDGNIVGATLDRNGLRPARYVVTKTHHIVLASEAGVIDIPPTDVIYKGRLQPGKMLVADLSEGRIISDEELKETVIHKKDYRKWMDDNKFVITDLPDPRRSTNLLDSESLFTYQQTFGMTKEDLKYILGPIVEREKEPVGSMGMDIPIAILSDQSQHIANYFKQLFAQVTNPPIDPIRERSVMSLYTFLGDQLNILEETPAHCKQIHLEQPILTNAELDRIKDVNYPDFKSQTINLFFRADGKAGRLENAIDRICKEAEEFIRLGSNILILSDRIISPIYAPIPTLLATGAIHHHLINKGLRAKASLVIEAGDVRETHHFATLLGYGASAINPYLAFSTLKALWKAPYFDMSYTEEKVYASYIKGVGKGLLKIFSKIGISTLHSYMGAQIFEVLGINSYVVNKCFKGTVSRIEGIGFDELAREVLIRHQLAFPQASLPTTQLAVGGVYQWKRRGEYHLFNPTSIHLLQYSTRLNDYKVFKKYTKAINDQVKKACTLRGLLAFKKGNPIPIEEVEPIENILTRFATGAMSFGSISHEAHTTLAIAMNRIGGKSNSGEGGEDEVRFEKKANGDWERSAIKQVASGRFGVTSNYLTNAEELQIKMAQGAKPGEGGQLPGHKVNEWIGRVRNATPGVGLISPPPHHDIYSIEDLAQLIFDLKNANRKARISVKLVAEAGVGIVASGVAKAHADMVLIAGHDGGTGASPLSSLRHAGIPWELGLSETHQVLVKNKLRSRIRVQVDGQIRTGRDLAIATLLGAEEWGVATAALVVEGCIMMRKCHLNTCPVGIATQNPELRKRFDGKVEHVVNFFKFLAQDLREIMAELGFRTINEMVGQVQMLQKRENIEHWKYKHLDLSRILYKEPAAPEVELYKTIAQDHGIAQVLDWSLLKAALPALNEGKKIKETFKILNTDRTAGAILSNEISKRYGSKGLPTDNIHYTFKGSAGQSFGAFGAKGLFFELIGESNDYFGKGLSGAKLVVYPRKTVGFEPSKNMIIGNVAFYGATSGEAYIRGLAGERFCVRNSGAKVVVEGVGDHACEYMTGGIVVILGETGRNFAAGMSGGMAYVYNEKGNFEQLYNPEMVDLEAIPAEDEELLKGMIQNHINYTKSTLGQHFLDNWETTKSLFIKVMPRDYKRVLLERKEQAKKEQQKAIDTVNKQPLAAS